MRSKCSKCGAHRVDHQIGLEASPAEYVANIVAVMREVWRVLKPDGTLWLNIGDSFAGSGQGVMGDGSQVGGAKQRTNAGSMDGLFGSKRKSYNGIKPKDMIGIPWLCAFALREDGWYLRSEIIWVKPSPMPESVRDRPTKSHEQIFLLSKQPHYFYDQEAIKEASEYNGHINSFGNKNAEARNVRRLTGNMAEGILYETLPTRNARDVWTISSEAYSGAHYATFPTELARRCILAGSSQRGQCPQCGRAWVRIIERAFVGSYHDHKLDGIAYGLRQDGHGPKSNYPKPQSIGWRPQCTCDAGEPVQQIVIDPFCGSGTVGEVCRVTLRRFVGVDLSLRYLRENALPRAENTNTQESIMNLPLFQDGIYYGEADA